MKTNQVNQVAAFGKLVGICNAHGAAYNPSKASIKAAALNTLLVQAQQSLQAATNARIAVENSIAARIQQFGLLPKLVTRIVSALHACGASPETLAYARALKRKINGKPRLAPQPEETPTQPDVKETVRPGHKSFERQASNFAELVARLATEPLYKPNETDLQVPALTTLATSLRDRNKAVANATVALYNARIARNKALFESVGIHGAAMEVKAYIKSVFGAASEQYRQLNELKFKNAA